MRVITGILCLFVFVGISCTREDDTITEEVISEADINFEAVGVDGNAIYQYRYNENTDAEEIINLSNELGLGSEYLTLRQLGKILSFYTFNQGKFSLAQKDLTTGNSQTYLDFYTNSSERSIVWGINNEKSVFFGYYSPLGSTNLAVQNISLSGFQGSDLFLEVKIEQLYQPLYHDQKLFVTYRNSASAYKIAIYDTNSYTLIQTLDYGPISPSILIDDNGNLAVFKFSNESKIDLEIRTLGDLSIMEEVTFELKQRFPTGPINAVLSNRKLHYEYEYSQPFDISKGPAILDIDSGENKVLDLLYNINEIEAATGNSIYIVWQQYDVTEKLFLVSYGTFNDSNILEGGVMILSNQGILLKNIVLPFIPSYFVK